MEKEYLIALKNKINSLSEYEKRERDIYLKKLATGEIQGPPTGYSSIDKPWLKYYRDEPIKDINPNQTMYDMVFNQENMKLDAIGYLGVNWTHEKLKFEVDKCADAFFKLGVRFGDVVLIGVSNTPETVVILLALNKIGAVSKWFDLRASEKDILRYANSSNCKFMVSFDMILSKVQNIIDKTTLDKVVVTSPVESLPFYVKSIYNLKSNNEKVKNDKFINYSNFIKLGDKNSKLNPVSFDKDRPSIMIQSSGTTGKPKTIVHSDYSITQCTREIAYSDLPLGKGKKILVALPPWIAYGIGDAIILPLALGTKVELCPNFEPDAVYKNIGKFTIVFAAPFHYRYLRDNISNLSMKKKEQLKSVECFVSGGDKITIEENKQFEEIFGTVVVNGYGNNEGWGALTVNPVKFNKYGTVGIPKYDEIIVSYDSEMGVELPYGEVGEICSLSNTQFLEYENNGIATNECKKNHEDSHIWLHTGDLGYVDSDGFLHLGGRARRVIVRLGFKISAYTIEDAISQSPYVSECVAVSVNDINEEHVPMVYVILKEEFNNQENIVNILYEYCKDNLKENEVPKYIRVVENLPYTKNGKYDFVKLEFEGNKFVEKLLDKDVKVKRKK